MIKYQKLKSVLLVTVISLLAFSSLAFAQTNTIPAKDYCGDLAKRLGGIPVPNGDVCDVAVVRKSPIIKGNDGMTLNKFTLMNSVLEFNKTGVGNQVYVMGDFALLETEMNNVLRTLTGYRWTVTGIHNHMVLESPKTTFVHWETKGDLDTVVNQINQVFEKTSIK